MKSTIYTILLSLLYIPLLAQEKLLIEYEVLPYYEPINDEGMESFAISSTYELLIDKHESQYDYIEKVSNTQIDSSGEMFGTFQITSSGTLYINTKEKIYFENTLFESEEYLIKDSLSSIDWKITKESKNIAGFEVRKATTILNEIEIEAWYAPKLKFKTGPDKFWGLPGLILELKTQMNYEDGGKEGEIITALKVNVVKGKQSIKVPSKGKVITQQAFDKHQRDSWDRQMEMYSNEGVDKD